MTKLWQHYEGPAYLTYAFFIHSYVQVFFIDHEHKITTFIDPRLPLPNTVFTYNTRAASASISATRRSALFDEQEIRPHHVTTVSTSSSAGELTPPTLNESTPARDETTPTPSEADGPASGGPESSSGPPSKLIFICLVWFIVNKSSGGPISTIFWFSESLEGALSDGMLKSQF